MSATPATAALAGLESALVRSRFRQIDLRLRFEMAAFGLLVVAFLGWRVRVPLDGLARARGPWAAFGALAAAVALMLALAAGLAAVQQRRALRAPPGPAWGALPLGDDAVAAHLARLSTLWAWWLAVPAIGVLAAGAGLAPGWALAALAALFVLALPAAGRGGAGLVTALRARPPVGLGPTRRLAPGRRARLHRGRFVRTPAWLALWRKDLVLSIRPSAARRRLVPALAFALAAALLWWLPLDPRLLRFAAFAASLIAAGAFAEWIIELCGTDPFSVLRALPVGALTVWAARVASAIAATALIVTLQALAHPPLEGPALGVQLVWTGLAVLAVGVLGANHGVTLYPHPEHALRVLTLTVAVAMAASLMIPLLGWVLLLAAIIHSMRRLPGWARMEAD